MYYDGTKLLSLMDLDGNKPEIYICTSNRSAGKTTYFSKMLVSRFIDKGEKFGLIYRFNYELDNTADKFFKDIQTLFFSKYKFESKRKANGIYHELFLNDKSCGYAISLNSADTLKKYSHLFSDIQSMLFDEFQSETNHYCPNEIAKLLSIHTSIARGQGSMSRYVPVYMVGNCVTMLNPYYISLGIAGRLRDDTKFLRGSGYVLEQGFNESASQAQKASAFNRAFSNTEYVKYSAENVYLNDNSAFIAKPKGKSNYIATLKYRDKFYGVREFLNHGIIFCDKSADMTFPLKLVVTTADHQVNYVMLKNNDFLISNLRYFFERGCFRFSDLECKEAILTALSY